MRNEWRGQDTAQPKRLRDHNIMKFARIVLDEDVENAGRAEKRE